MDESSEFEIVGVLHLPALPGAPLNRLCFEDILGHAMKDASALTEGGIQRCVIENFGDTPFRSGAVDPHVPAMLATIGQSVRRAYGMTVGMNVLRNDARAALGAAVACGAEFIRVNVLVGSAWTDQGLIHGEADSLLRYRRSLCGSGAGPRIYADVNVKHAVPAGADHIGFTAIEAIERSGADGVIVTGSRTGAPTDLTQVAMVRDAIKGRPVWVGSGVTADTIVDVSKVARGAIIGTALHEDGNIESPIDKDRVRSMVEALRS